MMTFDDGNPCTAALAAWGYGAYRKATRACRAVGNARKGPSSVRWVTSAIIAGHISRRTTF
jgi:hypothetical protein